MGKHYTYYRRQLTDYRLHVGDDDNEGDPFGTDIDNAMTQLPSDPMDSAFATLGSSEDELAVTTATTAYI